MRTGPASAEISLLLKLIDDAYEKKAWHGPNLRGAIRGIVPHEAAWRPAPGRHNIWEIVVHCAYWKYVVRRRILGEKRGSFPLKGSNWIVRPTAVTPGAWRSDVALLDEMHRSLQAAIAGLAPQDLLTVAPGRSKVRTAAIVHGVALHDVYHAGQIQLLKRLARQAAVPKTRSTRRP